MAELWFSALTRRLLRCGKFTSRADHDRHLARHAQHDTSATSGAATASVFPTAA